MLVALNNSSVLSFFVLLHSLQLLFYCFVLQISQTKSLFYPELSAEIIVGQSQGG